MLAGDRQTDALRQLQVKAARQSAEAEHAKQAAVRDVMASRSRARRRTAAALARELRSEARNGTAALLGQPAVLPKALRSARYSSSPQARALRLPTPELLLGKRTRRAACRFGHRRAGHRSELFQTTPPTHTRPHRGRQRLARAIGGNEREPARANALTARLAMLTTTMKAGAETRLGRACRSLRQTGGTGMRLSAAHADSHRKGALRVVLRDGLRRSRCCSEC